MGLDGNCIGTGRCAGGKAAGPAYRFIVFRHPGFRTVLLRRWDYGKGAGKEEDL